MKGAFSQWSELSQKGVCPYVDCFEGIESQVIQKLSQLIGKYRLTDFSRKPSYWKTLQCIRDILPEFIGSIVDEGIRPVVQDHRDFI